MKLPKFIFLLLTSFLLLCFSDARAQETYPTAPDGRWIYGRGEPLRFNDNISKEDIAEVTSRWHKIDNEDFSQNEWIGAYGVYGHTHMTLLKWSPANGYVVLSVNTCMAMIMRVQYGDAQIIGEQIFFYPKKSAGMSHDEAMPNKNPAPSEWIPVKWRGANYLLREDEVKDFCDYIAGFNALNDAGINPFYSQGEETGAADQPPILPKRFEHLIRKPLSGKIISVGKRKIIKIDDGINEPYFNSQTPVVINLGRADGVTEGMSFWVLNENTGSMSDSVELTDIREKTSIGFIKRYLEEKPQIPASRRKDSEGYVPIKTGWKITISQHIYWEHSQALESGSRQPQ